jgi:hypothetical protein
MSPFPDAIFSLAACLLGRLRRIPNADGVVGLFHGGGQRAAAHRGARARSATALVEDPHRIIDLPAGFTYRVIGKRGDAMSDGFFLPGQPDAMAAFQGPDADTTIIVRNHELQVDAQRWSPFGPKLELLDKLPRERIYDRGEGKVPSCGSTTVVYDTRRQKVVKQFLSLAGTINNCGRRHDALGHVAQLRSTTTPGKGMEQLHGYVFEVPASTAMEVTIPRPIKAMGRFRHEACAVDPASGVVFLTEDREDGLLYRFIPNDRTNLHVGGRLQALKVKDRPSLDTSNTGGAPVIARGERLAVEWIDVDEIDSPEDDLRHRGICPGAAKFARNEGMWYGHGAGLLCRHHRRQGPQGAGVRTPSAAEGTTGRDRRTPACSNSSSSPTTAAWWRTPTT